MVIVCGFFMSTEDSDSSFSSFVTVNGYMRLFWKLANSPHKVTGCDMNSYTIEKLDLENGV
jgi:hypothetical protein